MTLHPCYVPDVPEATVKVAKAAFRKGNRYMQMRDELFTDEQFAGMFPHVCQLGMNQGQIRLNPW